jgi:predicted ArsR family transcriptional regulator
MNKGTADADVVEAIALLDEPKRRRLYEFVAARREPVGRDEAAAALGIGRELAAFHLDRLAAAGLLDVEYRRLGERRGPGAGRPAKLYRRSASEIAVSLPARDYERLAGLLAEAIDAAGNERASDAADAVARARGADEGRAARARTAGRGGRAASRAALVELLAEVGYEPIVAPDGSIRLGNCPYHALSEAHRDLTCGMNHAWAEGLLGGLDGAGGGGRAASGTGLTATLAPEPGFCCVQFRASDSEDPSDPG